MKRIPLVLPHLPKIEDIEKELRQMLDSGRLTNFGPFSQRLEKKFCEMIGVKYALCVSNATTGLMLLLNSLPKGSEILVPSFTFLPTVQAVLWNSLKPIFVDIDKNTYTVLPSDAASKISSKTSAILAVHAFGNPCAIEELEDLAKFAGIPLFFDSAHAFGARHCDKYIGSFGEAEVFSLSATKTLPCGEGGVITTNNESLYHAILDRRNYGFKNNSSDCANIGLNGKITEFSAILGIKEIDSIDAQIRVRNQIARKYRTAFQKLSGIKFQDVKYTDISTYKDFTILIEGGALGWDRNILKKELMKRGVETKAYFSPAIHQMSYFQQGGFNTGSLKNTEAIERKILSLPIYYDLKDDNLDHIIKSVHEVYDLCFKKPNGCETISNIDSLPTDIQMARQISATRGKYA